MKQTVKLRHCGCITENVIIDALIELNAID